MQLTKSKGNIVEKVLFDKSGRLVRAKFFVYESGGRIKARLVDFSFINQIAGAVSNFLAGLNKKVSNLVSNLFVKSFEPAFVTVDILNSSGSKPRAPTFA